VSEQILENPMLLDHVGAGIALPISSTNHDVTLYTCCSWTNLPSSLVQMDEAKEKKLYSLMLSSIGSRYKLKLDYNPSVDRAGQQLEQPESPISALVLGGSNASRLVDSFKSLGSCVTSFTAAGWTLSASSCSTMIPTVLESCASLDRDIPVVMYLCLTTAPSR